MSEKGNLVTDQAGGKVIATRDAIELDDLTNARVIQEIDFCLDQFPSPIGTATRSEVTVDDGDTLAGLPAEVLTNIIECGDRSKLAILARFTGIPTQYQDAMYLAALFYDNEATPGYLGSSEAVYMEPMAANGVYINDGTYCFTRVHMLDLVGSPKVAMYIPRLDFNTSTAVSVWGFAV